MEDSLLIRSRDRPRKILCETIKNDLKLNGLAEEIRTVFGWYTGFPYCINLSISTDLRLICFSASLLVELCYL